MDEFTYSIPPNAKVFLVPREIDDESLSFDVSNRDKAPKATIITLVSVIPHDKKVPLGYYHRAEIVSWTYRRRKYVRIGVLDIRFFEEFAIYIDLFVSDLDAVSRKPYDTLYEVQLGVFGKDKDNHFFTFGDTSFDPYIAGNGVAYAVDHLINQDMVSYQEGGDHRARRDFEGLDEKGADEQGQYEGQGNGLYPLPYYCGYGLFLYEFFYRLVCQGPTSLCLGWSWHYSPIQKKAQGGVPY